MIALVSRRIDLAQYIVRQACKLVLLFLGPTWLLHTLCLLEELRVGRDRGEGRMELTLVSDIL